MPFTLPFLPHVFEILDLMGERGEVCCPRFGCDPGKQSFMQPFNQQHEGLLDIKICTCYSLRTVNGVTTNNIDKMFYCPEILHISMEVL